MKILKTDFLQNKL